MVRLLSAFGYRRESGGSDLVEAQGRRRAAIILWGVAPFELMQREGHISSSGTRGGIQVPEFQS